MKRLRNLEIWPGPMEGLSSVPFVRAAARLRLVRRWMTPFLRVSDTCFKAPKIAAFLEPFLESGLPVTAQIMGTRKEILAELAVRCVEAGAFGINLNCGCPSKRVVTGGAGGGALRDPLRLAETAEAIRRAVGPRVPFSVKMRSGFSAPEEMLDIIPRLADAGADKFFIHYRTVGELYAPCPGREKRLRRAVIAAHPLPVIVNGDISGVEDGLRLIDETGASGLMIARAFLRDPWLIARFHDPEVPPPEEGRSLFFRALEEFHATGGNRLELAKMIWGEQSPQFRTLLNDNDTAVFR